MTFEYEITELDNYGNEIPGTTSRFTFARDGTQLPNGHRPHPTPSSRTRRTSEDERSELFRREDPRQPRYARPNARPEGHTQSRHFQWPPLNNATPLPAGWESFRASATHPNPGRTYYVDPSGQTQWERPVQPVDMAGAGESDYHHSRPSSQPQLPDGWTVHVATQDHIWSGRPYYLHADGYTQWTRPTATEQPQVRTGGAE
ncbi:hypothetical protein EJ08DRAFT_693884 [Tothia fuscella]|uniref:WW domain-containing protein n=1 Tax=Tothia fuscella TaxID=1048955 RepID=A0A9P4NXQ9_9PEZI|nr:hypothetical protein EJ08DRAFT_693884 [Tothia fuscella]